MVDQEVRKLLGKDKIEDLDKFIVKIGTLKTNQERFRNKQEMFKKDG